MPEISYCPLSMMTNKNKLCIGECQYCPCDDFSRIANAIVYHFEREPDGPALMEIAKAIENLTSLEIQIDDSSSLNVQIEGDYERDARDGAAMPDGK